MISISDSLLFLVINLCVVVVVVRVGFSCRRNRCHGIERTISRTGSATGLSHLGLWRDGETRPLITAHASSDDGDRLSSGDLQVSFYSPFLINMNFLPL